MRKIVCRLFGHRHELMFLDGTETWCPRCGYIHMPGGGGVR